MARASLGSAEADACTIHLWHPAGQQVTIEAEVTIPAWDAVRPSGCRRPVTDLPGFRRVLERGNVLAGACDDLGLGEIERGLCAPLRAADRPR